MIKKNDKEIVGVYKGTTEISAVYKGLVLVYQNAKTMIAEGVPPITVLNALAKVLLGYRIYGNSKQGELPTGYTQLEYIEATGEQYIDTGITATNNTGMSIKYCYTASGPAGISGIFKSAAPRQDVFFISTSSGQTSSNIFCAHRGATFATSTSVTLNTDYTYEINYLNSGKVYFDNTLLGNVGSNNVYNKTIPLFARYSVGSSGYSISNSRIYYAEFSEGTVITHKFIPAKDINGVIGMYDTIADTFHTNAGTGTFTAGAEMPNPTNPIEVQSVGDNETGLPLGYTLLSYIEANVAQYIDTGFSPDGNTRVDYKVETTAGDFDGSPFIGARVGSANTARFFPIAYNNTNGDCRTAFGSKSSVISNVTTGTVFTGSFDPINGVSTVNGTDYDISSASFQKTSNYNLYLFATPGYTGNLYLSHGKIYYCRIYNNGTLARNFIPCKDTSNVVGMYDTVGKRFYGSETSTPLVAGEEIAKGGYKIPISVSSKNKYDISKSVLGGLSSVDGAESDNDARVRTDYIEIENAYSISMDTSLPYKILNAYFYDSNKNYVGVETIANTSSQPVKMYSGTKLADSTYMRVVFYSTVSSSTVIDLDTFKQSKIQIEEGSPTAYEEYFNRTENIYLAEPLRGFGDYTDYIDFETGKVVRNVEHLVITGQEDWQKASPTASLYRFLVSQEQIALSPVNYDYQKCNYFICAQVSVQGTNEGCSVYNSDTVLGGGAIFRVRKDIFTSLTAVTTFFTTAYNNGNPAYIDFVLATPTEESIELPDILLSKGTNVISVGTTIQPSDMWIKYKGK